MRINPVSLNNTPVNIRRLQNITQNNISDTVSFSAKRKFKYENAWYLKDEKIVDQDSFSTTVIDKTAKTDFIKNLTCKRPAKKIYDLPLRLREDLNSQKRETVIQFLPPDALLETGKRMDSFIREIDKINTFISIIHPLFDKNAEKSKQTIKYKIGNSTAEIEHIKDVDSGSIYKVQLPCCKPLCLKHFTNPNQINTQEGAFPEIAFAKKINSACVHDVPVMFCANPYNGWMLSEYVNSDYTSRIEGINFDDYLRNHDLECGNLNDDSCVQGKRDKIYVDFGHIAPKNSQKYTDGFEDVVLADKKELVNSPGYMNFSKRSVLSLADNISKYGKSQFNKQFFFDFSRNPEARFYLAAKEATDRVLNKQEIEPDLQERLQRNYEEIGFIGDVTELIKSCTQ